MTIEVNSTTSHLSATMTTTQNTVTSSWSRDADFYFGCAVIVLGVVGMVSNGFVLYALVASKEHKKHVLIFNQNILDLASCFFLVVIYALKISGIRLTGQLGYWLCMLLLSENLLWTVLEGSVINLTIITIERYLKVVHPIWSKNKLRKWMTYSAMAFPWIFSSLINLGMGISTSAVIDGVCHAFVVWETKEAQIAHAIIYFAAIYVCTLLIFVFCYGRILVAIRRQARVMAAHNTVGTAQSTAAQVQAHQIQSNVVKTMIFVCAFFAVSWLPENVYYLLMNVGVQLTLMEVDNARICS